MRPDTAPAAPSAPTPDGGVATHCPYCALQCAQTLTRDEDGLEVTPRAFPTNRGGMCQKGWTSTTLLRVPDRITTPRLRRDGELVEVGWGEALDHVAATVRRILAESGPDAVAVFGGGGLTNEKAYQLGKFARIALGTANIDYNGRFCMSSAAAAANRSLGLDRGLPFPLADLRGAQAVLLLGSNVAETMPPALGHLVDVRDRGGLVVVDPRRSATAALAADHGGVHLQPVPGTDLVVLLGLIHLLFRERAEDAAYLAERVSGAEDVRASVGAWWPERVEQVTGVPGFLLRRAAGLLAEAAPVRGGSGAFVLTGRGVEQSSQGTDTVTAAINLALVLGLVGRRGSGYGAITGQGNGQGGREHGQKADQLPGYRMIDDPAARAHVAAVWGVDPASLPGKGRPAVQLLRALGEPGGPRALLVHGANLRVSAPDVRQVARRLRALELLVVCDFVPSETTELADVVLPVTQWAEEEGTMTSLEGRVLRRRRALDPPAEVRSELWILGELARRLDAPGTWSSEPHEVFDELARASAGGKADYSGISHRRLDTGEAVFWPCPATPAGDAPHPGTPRLFLDRFPTPDGRARMLPVDHRGPAERPDARHPLHLVTGRVLAHYQSGAQTRRVAELNAAAPVAVAELHPMTADRLGVGDGSWLRLRNDRGEARVQARLSPDIRPDTVFVPFHFPGLGSVNRLTHDAVDPVSQMPEFKNCAVTVIADADPVPAEQVLSEGARS